MLSMYSPIFLSLLLFIFAHGGRSVASEQDPTFSCVVALSALARANRNIISDGQILAGFPVGGRRSPILPLLMPSSSPSEPIKVKVGGSEAFAGDSVKIRSGGRAFFGLVVATFQDSENNPHAIYLSSENNSTAFYILTDPNAATVVKDQETQRKVENSFEYANVEWRQFGSFNSRIHHLGSVYGLLPMIPLLIIPTADEWVSGVHISHFDWVTYEAHTKDGSAVRRLARVVKIRGNANAIQAGGVLLQVEELNSYGEIVTNNLSTRQIMSVRTVNANTSNIPTGIGLRITSPESLILWGGKVVRTGDQVSLADPEHRELMARTRLFGRLESVTLDAETILAGGDVETAALAVIMDTGDLVELASSEDLSQLRAADPIVDQALKYRLQHLFAKDTDSECPICFKSEVLSREKDPIGVGRRYLFRYIGQDPNSPQAQGGAKLGFFIARNPQWMAALGFEQRGEGIIAYPDVAGINARLDQRSNAFDNGLRFELDEEASLIHGELAEWRFIRNLSNSKISYPAKGREHFNRIEEIPALSLIPERTIVAAVGAAKMLMLVHKEFPEIRPELYMPARNLRELFTVRWPTAINDALTFRMDPLTSNLMNDSALHLIGNKYTLSELGRLLGGSGPRQEHDLEYAMQSQPLNPKVIARWVRQRVEEDLSPDRLADLDKIISNTPDVNSFPLNSTDIAQILRVNRSTSAGQTH